MSETWSYPKRSELHGENCILSCKSMVSFTSIVIGIPTTTKRFRKKLHVARSSKTVAVWTILCDYLDCRAIEVNELKSRYTASDMLAKRLKPGLEMAWCRDALITHITGASTGTSDNKRSLLAEHHSTPQCVKIHSSVLCASGLGDGAGQVFIQVPVIVC